MTKSPARRIRMPFALAFVAALAIGSCASSGQAQPSGTPANGPSGGGGLGPRVRAKMEEVQRRLQSGKREGRDARGIPQKLEEVREALRSGRPKDADAKLDEILAILGEPSEGRPRGDRRPEAEERRSAPDPAAGDVGQGGEPRRIRTGRIPSDAEIVFIAARRDRPGQGDAVYAMDREGRNITQLTFEEGPYTYEHVDVLPGRRQIVVNRLRVGARLYRDPARLVVYDLEKQTETELAPQLYAAGEGGVASSPDGYIYFGGKPSANEDRDIYRIRPDGSGFERLTRTEEGEGDTAVSHDGKLLVFNRTIRVNSIPKPRLWVMNTDGSDARMVYDGGDRLGFSRGDRKGSALGPADPEFSPDAKFLIFSMPNPEFNNFPNWLNDAHDIWVVGMDGRGLRKVTPSGGLQVVPDWKGNTILYTEISEADQYKGLTLIRSDGSGRKRIGPQGKDLIPSGKIQEGGRMGRWIRY